jgi:hypothetical protein
MFLELPQNKKYQKIAFSLNNLGQNTLFSFGLIENNAKNDEKTTLFTFGVGI